MSRNTRRMAATSTTITTTTSSSNDMFAETRLLSMHAKEGRLWMAWDVFRCMPEWDVVAWNALIAGYASSHDYATTQYALVMFSHMQNNGFVPDEATFVSVLKACGHLGSLKHAYDVHSHMIGTGANQDVRVCNTLVHVYAMCGSMCDACGVFLCMAPLHSVVSWTIIISGYAKLGKGEEALFFFHEMKESMCMQPDEVTFLTALQACAMIGDLGEGKRVHADIMGLSKIKKSLSIGNALIDMYAKCGSMEHALEVFNEMSQKDVISWTAIIVGYVKHKSFTEALNVYDRMCRERVMPNQVTFLSVLNACAGLPDLERGEMIHALILKAGIQSNLQMESALVDLYAKGGCMGSARDVFDKSKVRDSVSSNAMLWGYMHNGSLDEAYKLFCRMAEEGLESDSGTFLNALCVCMNLASLEKGKAFHVIIASRGFLSDFCVGTALIDMYCKCGDLSNARKVFNICHDRDMVLWAALVSGYAQHGMYKEARQTIDKMQSEGLQMNDVCFLELLSACSHEGYVDDGYCLFSSMSRLYEIRPRLEHYTCMVDMLGRAGRLEEGSCMVDEMAYRPMAETWLVLLGSCRINGNLKLAEHVSECIWKLDPKNTSAFLLLENVYSTFAEAEMRDMG